MVELLHTLELSLFWAVWDEAVAGSEQSTRSHTLLDEEGRAAHLEEAIVCCVKVVIELLA